jgi:hypothetical protein
MNFKPKAVFSTKQVINEGREILFVFHDIEDEWQFLSPDDVSVEDLMIVTLESILNKDYTVNEILNLKPGYKASRKRVGASWEISEINE